MSRALRLFAFLVLGLLLGGSASYSFAGYAQLKPPANLGGSVGSRVTAGTIAANAGQFSAGFTTQVAGKTVTMPATMRFASNAAQVALGAVRLSPASLVGSAVAAWLLTEGIQYIDGQFKKSSAALPVNPQSNYEPNCGDSRGVYPRSGGFYMKVASPTHGGAALPYADGNIYNYCLNPDNTFDALVNYLYSFPGVPSADPVEDDWLPLETQPLPDDVAEELAPKAVPIPLDDPVFNPQPVEVPLSNPYPKPKGQPGETVKDVAKVTPAPDEKVKIEIETQPVTGPNGVPIPATNPDGSSNPDAAPEEKSDFCIENPDALACWKEGEPENVDLEKVTAGTSITPVTVGGAGSCPAAKSVNYMGANLQISFTPICTAAGWINPIVLALAWLSAGFILIGAFKQG